MNERDRFASDGNISCFADQLRWETNPVRRERLKRLLIEEENRFGAIESRLAIVERNLREGADILVRQKRLIAEVGAKGGDTGSLESTLRTMEMIQDLFERFGAHIATRERGRI
jgi:hypothetical protein